MPKRAAKKSSKAKKGSKKSGKSKVPAGLQNWIKHVRCFAEKNGVSYSEALRHASIKKGYKKTSGKKKSSGKKKRSGKKKTTVKKSSKKC